MHTIFVANRGEIARRVFRTARALGYRTAAVATAADRGLPYVAEADVAVLLDGPSDVGASYLDGAKMIDAAKRAGADAVHPGYGFLSENADFAHQVLDAGLVWIGPSPSAIRAMGDKAAARRVAVANGVPVVPGWDGAQDDETLAREAGRVGFPVLIKATAGGGGRGMRRVDAPEDFADALRSARAEAAAAFGRDTVVIERYVTRPRHVEVQVVGDVHGAVVAFGERDCSVQRRHQKVLEEAPAPGLSDALRRALGEAAVRVAKAVGYASAGTVEFVVDGAGDWFFLEMNTRLQVEHPVTEEVTGHDLVALQLLVAEGSHLPFQQADVVVRGHSIEARIVAEDPLRDWLPATGLVRALSIPAGDGVRLEVGFAGGTEVSPFYDALLAKVIATGPDRATALRRLRRALDGAWVPGLVTNLPLLRQVVHHPLFAEPSLDTAFLARAGLPQPPPANVALGVLAALALGSLQRSTRPPAGWRVWGRATQVDTFRAGADEVVATWTPVAGGFDATVAGAAHRVRDVVATVDGLALTLDGLRRTWRVLWGPSVPGRPALDDGDRVWVHAGDAESMVELVPRFPAGQAAEAEPGTCVAPTPGKVTAVRVAVADVVEKGQLLVTLEAMKMEHRVTAPTAGRVVAVRAELGAAVREGEVLVRLELA
jgi:acetyl/propionyl-CoA carboxylase alpha subunit